MVNWLKLALPIVYLGILLSSLYAFSTLYRKRKAARAASLEPWFGPHVQRNIYLSLLHIEPSDTQPKIPESVIKAALLRRATEDIHRIMSIRNSKAALSALLQRGSVGDDLWQRFLRAEKEIEEELRDVVNEANAFSPSWGQTIFQSASEIAQNQMLRKRLAELQAQKESEKEWWENRQKSIQAEFMKELESDNVETATTAQHAKTPSRTSDDDAVLVEGGGPADKGIQQGGGKKKKGKGKH
ncbi:uncharacterized protein PV09_01839 [Verruconis gallopava]|uniref:Translocation protein sec66 n=1 Tax=Verruconis gallopava TaxID=253628 RepID=A0A0D1Z4P4_9PEZI|nr:uncharacterized protein PV09_01839 [Verruconis gallopava]KIW07932.1 hypothetical protein PV09_01839 [Verruconis gallopava]